MIGQDKLKTYLTELISATKFPNFSIFVGPTGCGKKLLISELFADCIYAEDVKVDTMRKLIALAYKLSHRTFVIANADTMSTAAQNAVLKVVEECPNFNKFIFTVESAENVLPTIRSRGTVFEFQPYTADELKRYALETCNDITITDSLNIIADICETMGDVIILDNYGVVDFYNYVEKVVDNIATVSGANAFKIADKINFKDDAVKYDLKLFLRAFRRVCALRYVNVQEDEKIAYLNGIVITTRYITELRIKGINKQSLFDAWLLDIRKDWMSNGDK